MQREVDAPPEGVDEEMERLNNEADGVIQLAIKEKEKHPERAEEIFEEALSRIKEDIFGPGRLGPASGSLDPAPFFERLGEAFGKFDEEVISDDLDLRTIVEVAHRAARSFGEKRYILGQRADTPAGFKTIDLKTDLPPDKALHKLEAAGITMDNLVHLDLTEPYFDVYRGQVFFDADRRLLIIKGTTEFVREALGEPADEE